jgi:hypothetical protein
MLDSEKFKEEWKKRTTEQRAQLKAVAFFRFTFKKETDTPEISSLRVDATKNVLKMLRSTSAAQIIETMIDSFPTLEEMAKNEKWNTNDALDYVHDSLVILNQKLLEEAQTSHNNAVNIIEQLPDFQELNSRVNQKH